MTDRSTLNRRRFLGAAALAATSLSGFSRADAMSLETSPEDEGPLPDLSGAVGWLNTTPLSAMSLRGKVVLVDVWTYSCINSLRQLPYLKSWAAKYRNAGLVVIGVHSPEFAFEKERANVERAVRELNIAYPVAIDTNHAVWRAFNNQYWPADYFVDAKGRIRHHHFGEGDYDASERTIRKLLDENGASHVDRSSITISGAGVEAPPNFSTARSPETYVGYGRAERFASPERLAPETLRTYSVPTRLSLNDWGVSGAWNIGAEHASPQAASGKIIFRFHSRDVHMVLTPTPNGMPVRFVVTVDGKQPGADCGTDARADGTGEVREPRLYQLVRQTGRIEDRTFAIEFLDAGVQAFAFTFG